jgi:hypothetical protein
MHEIQATNPTIQSHVTVSLYPQFLHSLEAPPRFSHNSTPSSCLLPENTRHCRVGIRHEDRFSLGKPKFDQGSVSVKPK